VSILTRRRGGAEIFAECDGRRDWRMAAAPLAQSGWRAEEAEKRRPSSGRRGVIERCASNVLELVSGHDFSRAVWRQRGRALAPARLQPLTGAKTQWKLSPAARLKPCPDTNHAVAETDITCAGIISRTRLRFLCLRTRPERRRHLRMISPSPLCLCEVSAPLRLRVKAFGVAL